MIGCECEVCQSANKMDKRLRSSILVKTAQTSVVVDSGPDFRQQMLLYGVKKLDAVILTHSHKDHIAGLDDVRAYNYLLQQPMDVYGSKATINRVMEEFSYAFSKFKYPGIPSIELHIIENNSFEISNLSIEPIPVWHLNMPVLGFRFGDFTYITDANRLEENAKEKIRGSQVLILNALRQEPHISHFTLQEGIDLADELEIPQVYFTHLSHQMGLHDVIDKALPPGRNLAYDGLQINL